MTRAVGGWEEGGGAVFPPQASGSGKGGADVVGSGRGLRARERVVVSCTRTGSRDKATSTLRSHTPLQFRTLCGYIA